MGIGEERLREAFEKSFGSKADAIEQMPAMLGAYINGQKTFIVNGQPDYVWVRVRGQTADRVKAFNQHAGGVAHHWDLPIIIARIPSAPDIWTVIGRDIRRYENWTPEGASVSSPYLVKHGGDHSFTNAPGMGSDPVWVFKRQMMPLLPHPEPTGTMSISLGSDFYYYNGQYNWFASTGTLDLTSFLPTGAMNGRFVTVYIEGSSGNPAYLSGPEINAVAPPIDAGDYIAVPTSDQGIPVAAVFLLTGTTRIGWGEIFDLRHPHVPVPATGSTSFIYDDGLPQGSTDSLNFARGINAAITGAFADISLDQGFSPSWTGNHTFAGTGTFQVPTMFEDLVGMAGDLHVTGTVYAGAGSFITEQGYYRGQYLDTIDQGSPPTAPAAGRGRWYSEGGIPYFEAPGGIIYDLSATGSGGVGGGGSGLGVYIEDEGSGQGTGTTLDFVGAGVTASVVGENATITIPGAGATGTTTVWMPNASPPTGTANDDEFADRSFDTTLWTEFDPDGIQTVDEQPYGLRLTQSSTAGDDLTGIYQSIPAGDFAIGTRVSGLGLKADFIHAGLALWEDATDNAGDLYVASMVHDANGIDWFVQRWNNYQSWNSTLVTVDGRNAPQCYIRIRRNGTTYNFEFSSDGIGWMRISSTTLAFVPTHFGTFINNSNQGVDIAGIFQFFRYLDYDVGLTNPLAGRRVLVG